MYCDFLEIWVHPFLFFFILNIIILPADSILILIFLGTTLESKKSVSSWLKFTFLQLFPSTKYILQIFWCQKSRRLSERNEPNKSWLIDSTLHLMKGKNGHRFHLGFVSTATDPLQYTLKSAKKGRATLIASFCIPFFIRQKATLFYFIFNLAAVAQQMYKKSPCFSYFLAYCTLQKSKIGKE